jgi:hypothetical protein
MHSSSSILRHVKWLNPCVNARPFLLWHYRRYHPADAAKPVVHVSLREARLCAAYFGDICQPAFSPA